MSSLFRHFLERSLTIDALSTVDEFGIYIRKPLPMNFPFIRPYPSQNIDGRAGQVFESLKLHYRNADGETSRDGMD